MNDQNNSDDLELSKKETVSVQEEKVREEDISITDQIAGSLADENVLDVSDEAMVEETPIPFDITKLTVEQIQRLQEILQATPRKQSAKKGNPTISLPVLDGKIVIDFKRAYLTSVRDLELNREVERHFIPVKLLGETEYKNVLYSSFVNSTKTTCEVLNMQQEIIEIEEGQTIGRESGLPVVMIRKEAKITLTVKLPNGEQIIIDSKSVNA